MNYVLFIGTPHHLAAAARGSLSTIKSKAKTELTQRLKEARKFEPETVGRLIEARDGIQSLTPSMLMDANGRGWKFPFMGIEYVIRVEKA